jgi:hypothetical protein
MWWPAVVIYEWEVPTQTWLRPVTTCVCRPEAANTTVTVEESPRVNALHTSSSSTWPEMSNKSNTVSLLPHHVQLELLIMSGVLLETCWAFNERWNNKFCYKVASCWLFLLKVCRVYCERVMNVQGGQEIRRSVIYPVKALAVLTGECLVKNWFVLR